MREPNLEELRTSAALQDEQARVLLSGGGIRAIRLRHAQLETWWERALAVIGAAILLVALVDNLWRML